ncbi:hypothetical protein FC093_03675 [Ilyomonas limi]|uniref:Uncharacterized protein n=1 Tax=Ilyomonas limi TaxID=2575867 RepID=A0A4U3L6F3_9BACT|nr:hypothetical protein [Ilyomonas limi]TKK70805.1 hypothetical protein FC093_03675 [Ilyomonas limi]
MDEPFTLTVPYHGQQHDFETQLIVTGYTYKFRTVVNDTEVFFERDDAGDFRALAPNADAKQLHSLDTGLLQAIAQQLDTILS